MPRVDSDSSVSSSTNAVAPQRDAIQPTFEKELVMDGKSSPFGRRRWI